MARCVIDDIGDAPCQCCTPGGVQMVSPARNAWMAPPFCWMRPVPAVTIRSCPLGCVCHAERAPASNDTEAQDARMLSFASKSGVTRTLPVNVADGPGCAGLDAPRVMTMV